MRVGKPAGAVLILLLAAACSTPAPTPATSPTATSTSTSARVNPADQQAATRALPTATDLGASYGQQPYDPESSSAEDARVNACLGLPPTREHETARAYSPLFTKGDAQQIQFGITFADSDARAVSDLQAYSAPTASKCLEDSFRRQLEAAGRQADLQTTRIDPSPGGGQAITYRIIAQYQGVPTVVDVVSAVQGRAEVSATFLDVNSSAPADLEDRLVRLCLMKLAGSS